MRKALETLPGVVKVETDTKKTMATVTVTGTEFDIQKAIEALDKAGYESSLVK
ncbi:MAG: heavy-metal-associated domain-containing protein [Planctomycetaceae bacterium]